MKCKYCGTELYICHPWNSSFDLGVCLNGGALPCMAYRQPQRYIPNPTNLKLFYGEGMRAVGFNGLLNKVRIGTGTTTREFGDMIENGEIAKFHSEKN